MAAIDKRIIVGAVLGLVVLVPAVGVVGFLGMKKLAAVAPASSAVPLSNALMLPPVPAIPEPVAAPIASAPEPADNTAPPTSLAAAFGQALGVAVKDEPAPARSAGSDRSSSSSSPPSKPGSGDTLDLNFSAGSRAPEFGGSHREASLVARREHKKTPREAPAPAEKITFEADPR